MRQVLAVVCAVAFVSAVSGFVAPHTMLSVRVLAHKDECFYEDVNSAGTKVFLHFAVTNGGALDIDAAVYGPDNQLIWTADKEMEGRILFKAKIPGPHRFCFSNRMSTVSVKTVTFSVHVGDSAEAEEKLDKDPLQRSISHLKEGLTEIKNEQTFLRVRDRDHRTTAETINTRVMVWSIVEILIIVGLTAAELMYLVGRFEKRRNV
eukprot:CAMPEP_0174854436 /NCGR_PEP_ID=MMETSP1114-20130205/31146_1 /TAXON_ID=312471 /ORGANISM="Neobodo designis, Strain CCAP 1951/1" /LENGTH=205 /DNA_ID=CAMNT_0016089129 /DNA_START=30 /DNA_END=647 /DNA_ORIENTATION=+